MFQTLEFAAALTHVDTTKPVRDLARLRARHETRRNAEMSDYLPIFEPIAMPTAATPKRLLYALIRRLLTN